MGARVLGFSTNLNCTWKIIVRSPTKLVFTVFRQGPGLQDLGLEVLTEKVFGNYLCRALPHTRNPKTPISRLLDLFPSSPIPCYISCTLHRNREASIISLREYIGNFRVFYCKCQNSIPRFHCLVKLRAYCILLPCGSLALPASETDPTGMPPMAAAARRTAGSLMENVSCTADLHGC